MAPLPEYSDDLFHGVLPAPGDGPVEDLGSLSKDLAVVLKVVKGTRNGYRIFSSHPHVLKTWHTEAGKFLLRVWQSASHERRSAFKRSLEAFNATLQADTVSLPAVLPSFDSMRVFLAPSHTPQHASDLAFAHLATPAPPPNVFTAEQLEQRSVPVKLVFDPARPNEAHEQHSLARAPRASLGLRAAARYGLDKDEWERRARAAHERFL
ncbi:hypothetical protein JCM8208_001091 [Rhodotorula glutinis]